MLTRKIIVGDKVLLAGESKPLKVTHITEEDVKITRTLTVTYTRLYFDKEHKPVYMHKVKEIIDE